MRVRAREVEGGGVKKGGGGRWWDGRWRGVWWGEGSERERWVAGWV